MPRRCHDATIDVRRTQEASRRPAGVSYLLPIQHIAYAPKHHKREISMATCPICKSEAQEIYPGSFDGTTFRCPNHNEFDVSDSVLKTRMNATSEEWEAALKKATDRASGKRPKIFDPDFQ